MQVPRDSSARLVTGLPSSQRGTAPRVFAYPKGKSAYTESFYGAVEALGVRVIPGLWSRSWLDGSLRPGDCVHLHWPSLAYQTLGSASDSTRRFLSFCRFLLHARRRRARLIWTAHNLMPHEASSPATLDVLGRNLLIWLSERILVQQMFSLAVSLKLGRNSRSFLTETGSISTLEPRRLLKPEPGLGSRSKHMSTVSSAHVAAIRILGDCSLRFAPCPHSPTWLS